MRFGQRWTLDPTGFVVDYGRPQHPVSFGQQWTGLATASVFLAVGISSEQTRDEFQGRIRRGYRYPTTVQLSAFFDVANSAGIESHFGKAGAHFAKARVHFWQA